MNRDYYRDMSDLFNDIFSDGFSFLREIQQPIRFNKVISTNSFPPANVFVDQISKVLTIEVALAGCSEDDINLSFDADYLKLKVNTPKRGENENSKPYYIQRGLKKIDTVETSWSVDPRFYDRENVDVSFENGLLTICINPREDVRPKQIKLFGNLQERPAIEEK